MILHKIGFRLNNIKIGSYQPPYFYSNVTHCKLLGASQSFPSFIDSPVVNIKRLQKEYNYTEIKQNTKVRIANGELKKGTRQFKNNETIAPNSEIEYSIVYEFKETNKNQNTDINKTFKSNIKVTAHEIR